MNFEMYIMFFGFVTMQKAGKVLLSFKKNVLL